MKAKGLNIFWIVLAIVIISLEVFIGPTVFVKTATSLTISSFVISVWSIIAIKNLYTLSIAVSSTTQK